jgi:hypothetical protein
LHCSSSAPVEVGRIAGEESRPRTFSITTYSGCSASIALACATRDRIGAGCQARALADGRDILTREPATENIDGFDAVPADGRDVSEVRGVGPVVGEDASDGFVDVREPDRPPAEDLLDGKERATVPGEQRSDSRTIDVGFRNEDSGSSVFPGRHPR